MIIRSDYYGQERARGKIWFISIGIRIIVANDRHFILINLREQREQESEIRKQLDAGQTTLLERYRWLN